MAGTGTGFNRSEFEAAIRTAMRMGAPATEEDQATFFFRRQRQVPSGVATDMEGNPLDPNVVVPVIEPDPVRLEHVAVEYTDASPDELPVGVRIPTKLILTLLDAEYQQVKNAVAVRIGGDRYQISHRPPPLALFDSPVHQLVAYAEAET